jgi:hypothetical protein
MQDVSDKLLNQFVACLEQRMAPEDAGEAPEAPVAAAPDADPLPASPTRDSDATLDLGATVLPVLVKTYWKHAVGALVAVGVIVWVGTR